MVWVNPAALIALFALVGPLVVHLLRRQRARIVIVPTIRFIPGVNQSVVRVRTPSDGWLLVLRMAIIACAVAALAQPLLLTDARAAAWDARVARVVVVDVSESAAVSSEGVAAELGSAAFSHRIDATELAGALRRAAVRLEASPPARREIVVLSDFQHGVLDAADVERIPPAIGLRFVPVRAQGPAKVRDLELPVMLSEDGALRRQVRIDQTTTGVTYLPEAGGVDGLRLLAAPQDAEAAGALLRIVARAGAHAPSASQPIVVRFPGGAPLPASSPGSDGWAAGAALRLLQVADAARLPLTAATAADTLLVDVQAAPGTLAAAESLKASLDARADPRALAELDVALIPEDALKAWSRDPAPADAGAWRQADDSDGRWFWLAALLLLGVETVVRRSPVSTARNVERHAA
jgi:hypothetical protein